LARLINQRNCASFPLLSLHFVQQLSCVCVYSLIQCCTKKSQTSVLVKDWLLEWLQWSTAWVSVSVKDISIESVLGDLLFIGTDSEGGSVGRGEGDNEMWHMWLGWRRLIRNKIYNFTVRRNLFSTVCVIIVTFCANCLSDSNSATHTVYLDQPTNRPFTPHSARSVWHLPLALEDSWTCLLTCRVSSSQLTADCCSAVMLKANKTGTVLDLCKCR